MVTVVFLAGSLSANHAPHGLLLIYRADGIAPQGGSVLLIGNDPPYELLEVLGAGRLRGVIEDALTMAGSLGEPYADRHW